MIKLHGYRVLNDLAAILKLIPKGPEYVSRPINLPARQAPAFAGPEFFAQTIPG